MPHTPLNLLPGVPEAYVLRRLNAAAGGELSSGKFASAESSAALAVNCFGWFHPRPHLLPRFPGVEGAYPAHSVDVEACVRFPWSGGRHPWLDALVTTSAELIGIESKRFEPFRDGKRIELSEAYNRPVWGDAMKPFETVRDDLRARRIAYQHLDAAQLAKHAFGLTTQARRLGLKPVLVYLFAEPAELSRCSIPAEARRRHRDELEDFAARVAGANVAFYSLSYSEWIASWIGQVEVIEHGRAVLSAFAP